jgi:hypothetical protein
MLCYGEYFEFRKRAMLDPGVYDFCESEGFHRVTAAKKEFGSEQA